jgi:hypothetical protein
MRVDVGTAEQSCLRRLEQRVVEGLVRGDLLLVPQQVGLVGLVGQPDSRAGCPPPGSAARPLDNDVLVGQAEGRLMTMSLRTMVTPLRDDARWPSGPVRLISLPV